MSSQSGDEQLGLVFGLVFAIVAVVIALVIAAALHRPGAATPATLTRVALLPLLPAPAPADPSGAAVPSPAQAAQAASDAASITVEYGVVKFYFASGKAELAPGAGEALVDVVRAAKGGKTVVIAGFHDSKGNATLNAALARERALAVRDALKAAGVADSRISLQKPEQMAGSGSAAEARRVEITLR
ncbi:MAG: OmpA family protein [Polaromonas sp.]|nr:OmpA family protein [Polaromonas sp.]